jgi:tol-pal system protein YbgF
VQDYAAARDSFEAFLDTYPDDPLANDARYWLADAAFAEGDYVVAANNFVRVYNTAPTGEKSEETLLKLAVVLRRLERPKSACDALSRLDGRLDGMPDSFRERVANERQRSGCG